MLKSAVVATLLLVSSCTTAWNQPNVLLLEGVGGSGSGVVIADDWILTAKHVLPVTTAGGFLCGPGIPHPTLDLALIFCLGVKPHGLEISLDAVQPFERIYAYGWHVGDFLMKTEGYQGVARNIASAPAIYGCSGGAVTNSDNELVGIITDVLLIPVRDGIGAQAIPHVQRYAVLDEDVRAWIEGIIE